MKRRTFSALTLGSLSSMSFAPVEAQTGFKEGTDYFKLSQAVPTEVAKGRVEVLEFFWYNCPHCNAFEPTLSAWSKKLPKEVEEALGKVEELQTKMFAAIHIERQTLTTLEPLLGWAEKNGIAKKQFTDLYNSFAVIGKARRAAQLQEQFKVEGVPALGVAGRFYVDGSLAGSMERALQIVDFLIGEVRKGR
jgi:thiol:disulfide interchange protein DsbA